jgi:hypothetical protein
VCVSECEHTCKHVRVCVCARCICVCMHVRLTYMWRNAWKVETHCTTCAYSKILFSLQERERQTAIDKKDKKGHRQGAHTLTHVYMNRQTRRALCFCAPSTCITLQTHQEHDKAHDGKHQRALQLLLHLLCAHVYVCVCVRVCVQLRGTCVYSLFCVPGVCPTPVTNRYRQPCLKAFECTHWRTHTHTQNCDAGHPPLSTLEYLVQAHQMFRNTHTHTRTCTHTHTHTSAVANTH